MTEEILKPFGEKSGKKQPEWKIITGFLLLFVLGIGSGWSLAKFRLSQRKEGSEVTSISDMGEKIKIGETYGRADHIFKDTAIGVLEKNGIGGEGTHRLLREGGESQTAYLTSSVLDLDLFIGHKVQVWGETFAAQKAGWLMDVGKIKVLE